MSPTSRPTSPALVTLNKVVVVLLGLGVLVNALIAGRYLIGEWDIEVHGIIGNVVFVLALAVLGLAIYLREGRAAIITAAVLAVLVFAQVGLGYSGRDNLGPRAWHIPNGVLIFGLTAWIASRALASSGGATRAD
jgi:hypothetical protein